MLSSYVPDPLQSAQIHESAKGYLLEPDSRSQRPKAPDCLWIIKITYPSVETNKLQRVLPRAYPSTDLNQFSIQQDLHILAAVNS